MDVKQPQEYILFFSQRSCFLGFRLFSWFSSGSSLFLSSLVKCILQRTHDTPMFALSKEEESPRNSCACCGDPVYFTAAYACLSHRLFPENLISDRQHLVFLQLVTPVEGQHFIFFVSKIHRTIFPV